ncbi:hypothetical protein NC653_025415 [Populus alba x Populus x berolinensis]|nr:hypothetical protein NC653_025415 [Populus alba x Populus x berolinensis]
MSKYSGAEGIASFAFILFVLSWILLRLIYYPFWVLWSTRKYFILLAIARNECAPSGSISFYWLLALQFGPGNHESFILVNFIDNYEVLLNLDKEKHAVDGPIYYYVFNTLLYCLLVLHIYWWVLMYRMLVKQIQARGQLSDDVRSGMHEKHVDCMVLYCNMRHERGFKHWRCSLPKMEHDQKLISRSRACVDLRSDAKAGGKDKNRKIVMIIHSPRPI